MKPNVLLRGNYTGRRVGADWKKAKSGAERTFSRSRRPGRKPTSFLRTVSIGGRTFIGHSPAPVAGSPQSQRAQQPRRRAAASLHTRTSFHVASSVGARVSVDADSCTLDRPPCRFIVGKCPLGTADSVRTARRFCWRCWPLGRRRCHWLSTTSSSPLPMPKEISDRQRYSSSDPTPSDSTDRPSTPSRLAIPVPQPPPSSPSASPRFVSILQCFLTFS